MAHDSAYFLELQTKTGWGRMLESFTRWCAPQQGNRTLDVGCGPGLLPALFARAGAVALGCDHDMDMFAQPLHPGSLLAADGAQLPFADHSFEMVTASNLLYLHPAPRQLLAEFARVVQPGGAVCVLNPSEQMTVQAAAALADENGLTGLARDTLINYAQRAEDHFRWGAYDLAEMFTQTGLQLTDTTLRMGPGLVRYGKGILAP